MKLKQYVRCLLLLFPLALSVFLPEADAARAETDNGIPAVFLTVDPEEYEMAMSSPDHSYRAKGGKIRIELPEGYGNEFSSVVAQAAGEALSLDYLRGRGNSTWLHEKKSFKIKLQKGADLLGMGKSKHWILLANAFDPSLLRNRLVLYMGRRLGLAYTPRQLPVDLYINGEYRGSYVLSQSIRIGKSSVDIDEMEPSAVSEPEITGGYILAMNPYPHEPVENTFTTSHGVRFKLDRPSFATEDPSDEPGSPEQREYITDWLQQTEDTIFGESFVDGGSRSLWTQMMDAESAARYWWLQEFIASGDAFRSPSTYLYKERNGKLYWGPLWDFDIALNPAMYADSLNNTQMPWLDHLRAYDPEYQSILLKVWEDFDLILEDITRDGGVLDQYAEEIRASWMDDNEVWKISKSPEQCFEAQITELRQFINSRRYSIRESLPGWMTDVAVPDTAVRELPVSTQTTQAFPEGQADDIAAGMCGTCFWRIDAGGHMTIAPLDGNRGELSIWSNAAERPWSPYVRKITGVSFKGTVIARTCLAMFYGCYYLKNLDLTGLDTSHVSMMRGMFAWCWSLPALDLSGLDTACATNMREMFLNCDRLTALDVSGFNTSNVTTMRSMFANCRHLTSIGLSLLDVGKVTDMTGMFSGCASLRSLDLSGWDTADDVTMRSLFFRCRSLIHLNLTGLNPSRIRDKDFMFAECESLTDLKWDGYAESDDICMFLDCPIFQTQGS